MYVEKESERTKYTTNVKKLRKINHVLVENEREKKNFGLVMMAASDADARRRQSSIIDQWHGRLLTRHGRDENERELLSPLWSDQ